MIQRDPSHLATLPEITRHLKETVVSAVVAEKALDLVLLFESAYISHTTTAEAVEVEVQPLRDGLPRAAVRADRLIVATGADTAPLAPLKFSTSTVHSLSPNMVLTPEWTLRMRFGPDADKPIFVLGSGKTSLDTIYCLTKAYPDVAHRIRCISGSGTWFMNRAIFFPSNPYEAWAPWSTAPSDILARAIELYDGTNANEVYRAMAEESNAYVSAIPNPQTHKAGLASVEEIEHVRGVLSPSEDKVFKAYLLDVTDDPDDLDMAVLTLRPCAAKSGPKSGAKRGSPSDSEGTGSASATQVIRAPRGSFVINCTGHLKPVPHSAVLSGHDRVLQPQSFCGFSGPSANYLTHLFYLGTLDPWLRSKPRWDGFTTKQRLAHDGFGIELMATVSLMGPVTLAKLPQEIRDVAMVPPTGGGPLKQLLAGRRFKQRFPELFARYCKHIAPGKWGDVQDTPPPLTPKL